MNPSSIVVVNKGILLGKEQHSFKNSANIQDVCLFYFAVVVDVVPGPILNCHTKR